MNNDDYDDTLDLDVTYSFELDKKLEYDYTLTKHTLDWLTSGLSVLTDDNHKTLFNVVNSGYTEDKLRTFGNKPVVEVCIDEVTFREHFNEMQPRTVESEVYVKLKGTNNETYEKACVINDYLLQEFCSNESLQCSDKIRNTSIVANKIKNVTIKNGYGAVVGFKLSHKLKEI